MGSKLTHKQRLIIGMLVIVGTMIGIFVGQISIRQKNLLLEQQLNKVSSLAHNLAISSAIWVQSRDYEGLQEIIDNLQADDALLYAIVLDREGLVLAHTDVERRGLYIDLPAIVNSPTVLRNDIVQIDFAEPIWLESQLIGLIRLSYDGRWITNELNKVFINAATIIVFTLLLTWLFARWAATYLTRQLQQIESTVDAYLDGDLHQRTGISGNDEVTQLAARFDQMLDQLQFSRERLKIAASAGLIGFWDWDVINNRLIWDEVTYQLYGFEPAHDVDDNAYDVWINALHPDDRQDVKTAIHSALINDGKFDISFRIVWPDGSVHALKAYANTLFDDEGNALRMIGGNYDMTEQQNREQILLQAKQIAENANRAKTDFLANMSHEIRTPMNAILGMSRVMMESALDKNQRQQIELIYANGQSLLQLINDILDLSRVEAGRIDLHAETFDLRSTLIRLIETYRVQIPSSKALQLQLDIADNVPQWVAADGPRIKQILTNLLGNAIKFTEQGRVTLKVGLLDEREQTVTLRFEIIDTGIGMDNEQQQRLFQRFTQGDGSTTRRYGGTGLGLSISQQLAQLMGSEIRVSSEVGQGSCFSLDLALLRSEPPAVEQAAELMQFAGRVLIVDDMESNLMTVSMLLKMLGIIADSADGGASALQLIKDQSFDLMITDISMPDMDGFELTRHIRKREQQLSLARLPIIALTADVMEATRHQAFEKDMDDFLTKPVSIHDLQNILRNWLPQQVVDPSRQAQSVPTAKTVDSDELKQLLQQLEPLLSRQSSKSLAVNEKLLQLLASTPLEDSYQPIDQHLSKLQFAAALKLVKAFSADL